MERMLLKTTAPVQRKTSKKIEQLKKGAADYYPDRRPTTARD